ncbi:MAG: STAS domain-containing protein [Burkholderiales bacterium]|nr:STAS domain-containing protein [Burkholderiales bacterium]
MRREGDRLVLEGPVNFETAPALFADARKACREGAAIVDFAAVGAIDSAAVAMALALLREAQAEGRQVAIANVPAAMANLASLYSVSDIIAASRA